jgi:hypothetical protein
VVDAVSLLVFTLVGLGTHRAVVTGPAVLRDAGPFLGAWFVLVPLSGVYRRPGWGSLMRHWALAIPVGVLARQLWLGRPFNRGTLIFLLVGLGSTLLFLVTGRLVTMGVLRWRGRGDS